VGRVVVRGVRFASHDRVGLLGASAEEQLAKSTQRGVLVFHQVGNVNVRLEDRANQLEVLLVELLVGMQRGKPAQKFVHLTGFHFDHLRRFSLHDPTASVPHARSNECEWSTNRRWRARAVFRSASSWRANRTPVGRRGGSRRVASREQDRQLMRCQGLRFGILIWRRWPPGETSFGEPFVTKPKTLAIVHQCLDRSAFSIAENEHRAVERIVPKRFFAESRQAVDSLAKIGRFDGDQNLHLRRDLQHHSPRCQKPRPNATRSGVSHPFKCTRRRPPVASSNSMTHSPAMAGGGDGSSTNAEVVERA